MGPGARVNSRQNTKEMARFVSSFNSTAILVRPPIRPHSPYWILSRFRVAAMIQGVSKGGDQCNTNPTKKDSRQHVPFML